MTMTRQSGFTLIELIMVITLVSILAVYAIPKLDIDIYREAGFVQQASSSIRYAQKQAMNTGCEIDVSISATACNLNWNNPLADANCPADNTTILNPGTVSTNFCSNSTPNSTAGLPANFTFDKIGRPSAAQSINLGNGTIVVEAETGFTHET